MSTAEEKEYEVQLNARYTRDFTVRAFSKEEAYNKALALDAAEDSTDFDSDSDALEPDELDLVEWEFGEYQDPDLERDVVAISEPDNLLPWSAEPA